MSTVFADKLVCKTITLGSVEQLQPDLACQINTLKKDYLPDLTFFALPGTCYSSTLTATIGAVKVTGTSLSGLTATPMNDIVSDPLNPSPSTLTVASVISFKNLKGQNLGKIFTQDTIVNFDDVPPPASTALTTTKEQLVVVGGTRQFNGSNGNLTIMGNALYQKTTLTGKICADGDDS
ncbi:MAG: hypothetical protein ABL925_12350 [Methylococcales bacterium]